MAPSRASSSQRSGGFSVSVLGSGAVQSETMSLTSQDKKAKKESARLDRKLMWFLWLPVPLLLVALGWVKRRFVTAESPTELRVKEKDRQAGIRREMRGLSTVHDASRTRPPTAKGTS